MTLLFALALLHDPASLILVAGLLFAFWLSSRPVPSSDVGVPAFFRVYGTRTPAARLSDPDAAGKPHPRAPSGSPVFAQ
ncbi:DUF6412 domain-containing protein [Nonomuraea sp. NPDC050663]|uniref:DUF6412 domain-containing protein n=1 Tax=Nonomuraea sp. NPDC050663 TaxID=3364370 RepID=UPI003788FB23